MDNSNVSSSKKGEGDLKYLFLGVVIVVVIQTLFMYVGMLIEKNMRVPITGIPSAVGLTVVLIVGLLSAKKSKYILLGSFTLAFISPLILALIVILKAMDFTAPHIYYSIAYLGMLILIVWGYYIRKILKNEI